MAWNRSNRVTLRKRVFAWIALVVFVSFFVVLPAFQNPKFDGFVVGTVVNIRPSSGLLFRSPRLHIDLKDGGYIFVSNTEGRHPSKGEQICLEKFVRSSLFNSVFYRHAAKDKCEP